MIKTVKARFAGGVLTPLDAITLPEGALVKLTIDLSDPGVLKEILHDEDVARYFRVLQEDEERAQGK